MSIILSHSTARAVWRLIMAPPQPEEPPLPVAKIANSKPTPADVDQARRYLERHDLPAESIHCMTLSKHSKASRLSSGLTLHIDSVPLDTEELFELEPGIYLPCIEACALQAATEMPLEELTEYYYELCGSYGLSPSESNGYVDRYALTNTNSMSLYFKRAKGVRGAPKAKQALSYVRNGCRSPLETAMSLLIVLPRKMGGLGIRRYQTNYKLAVPAFASKLTRRSHFYFDGFLEASKTDLEYNGFWHNEAESAAIDEERRLALASMGYSVITINKKSIFDKTAFRRIMTAIQRREKIPPSRLPDGFSRLQDELRLFVLRRYLELEEAPISNHANKTVAAPIEPLDPLEALEINAAIEPDERQLDCYQEPDGKVYGSGLT